MEILKLINTLISYFASKEVNYNTRTLLDLYEEESKIQNKLIELHSDPNHSPNGTTVQLLNNQLNNTRKLKQVLEAKTLPS